MVEGYSHEWLGPFIPKPPALVLCSGESSAGKTVLGYNIAFGFAAGGNVLGYEISEPTRVLYVDLETPPGLRGSMAKRVGGLGVWTLIDFIRIVTGNFKDNQGNVIRQSERTPADQSPPTGNSIPSGSSTTSETLTH